MAKAHREKKKAKPAKKANKEKLTPLALKVLERMWRRDANTGKHPKKNYMCRAYKKAYQLAKGRGRRIPDCKLEGRKAYADARDYYDKYVFNKCAKARKK